MSGQKGRVMSKQKVGVFVSRSKSPAFVEALGGYQLEMDHSQSPDFLSRLGGWKADGCLCAVVDEGSIGSKAKMVAEVAGACSRGEAPPVIVVVSKKPGGGTDPRVLKGLPGCVLVDTAEVEDAMASLGSAVDAAASPGKRPAKAAVKGSSPDRDAAPTGRRPPKPASVPAQEPPAESRSAPNARPAATAGVRRIVIDPENDAYSEPGPEGPSGPDRAVAAVRAIGAFDFGGSGACEEDPYDGVDDLFDAGATGPIPTTPVDTASERSAAHQDPPPARIGQAAVRYHAAKGQTVIACCGTIPRSGCSTLAIAVARSLVLAGKTVAVCVSSVMFRSLDIHYRDAMSVDRTSCRINGVVFIESRSTVHPALPQFDVVVLDLGYVSFDPQDRESYDDVAAFHRADLKLVQMPLGTVTEIHVAQSFVRQQDAVNLGGYRIGLYSASEDVVSRFRGQLHMVAPQAYVWSEAYCPWPISAIEVPAGIAGALEPAIRLSGEDDRRGGERKGRPGLATRIAGLLGSGRGAGR